MAKQISSAYVDSCPLIDLVKYKVNAKLRSEREKQVVFTDKLLSASKDGKIALFSSTITVAEAVHTGDRTNVPQDAQDFFDNLLLSNEGGVELVQPTLAVMERARSLIWEHKLALRGADCIHLATALMKKCSEFITTDGKISRIDPDTQKSLGIRIITSADTSLLPVEYLQEDLRLEEVLSQHSIGKAEPTPTKNKAD